MRLFAWIWLACQFFAAPVLGNTSGNTIIFTQETGVTLSTYGYDTKQDSRLGQLTAEYSQELFNEEKFNALRVPLRAAYYPDWEYDTCPWNGHPEPGVVNPEAYSCSLSDIANAKSVYPNVILFASLKMAYYDGSFYDYLPDRCYYHDEDKETGLWDGEKSTRTKPAEYAQLLADFLNYFYENGHTFDWVGIENESGYINPDIYKATMEALNSLRSDGLVAGWPTKGWVYPETYSPSGDWMRDLAKIDGLQYMQASGIHYYGDEREEMDEHGRLELREKLISWKGSVPEGMPKWQTEAHWSKATDLINRDRENATQVDSIENMVLQYVDYFQNGIDTIYWWSYKKPGQSYDVDDNLQKNVMYEFTVSTSGTTYVLTDDQDGKGSNVYSFVTMGSKAGNTVTLWISNNKVGRAWDDYEIVIGDGTLATCTATEYSAVSYMQYHETDEMVVVSSGSRNTYDEDVELPDIEIRYGEATITAANAFTLPIPAQTVTKITFDVVSGTIPEKRTSTFLCDSDVSVLEDGDTAADPSLSVLELDAKKNNAAYGLLKFQTPGITGSVLKATLHVHVASADFDELLVESVANDWDASTVKFSTAPHKAKVPLDSKSMVKAGTWYELDVLLAFEESADAHSFLLSTSVKNEETYVDSMESDFAPYLVVENVVTNPEATGVCATPPMAPPPSPDWDSYYAMDGCSTLGTEVDGAYFAVDDTQTLAVACCTRAAECYTKLDDVCFDKASRADAQAICEAQGDDLCTFSMLTNGACCDKGCDINSHLAWTSMTMEDMYHPPAPPIEYCKTEITTKNAKCYDYTTQEKFGTEEDVRRVAQEGGFAGYAYTTEHGKGQLFTDEECIGINGGDDMKYDWFIFSRYDCNDIAAVSDAEVDMEGDMDTISDGTRRRLHSEDLDTDDYEDSDEYAGRSMGYFLKFIQREVAAIAEVPREAVRVPNITVYQTDNGPRLKITVSVYYIEGNDSSAEEFQEKIVVGGTSLFSQEFRDVYNVGALVFGALTWHQSPPPPATNELQDHAHTHDSDDHSHNDETIIALLATILVVLLVLCLGSFFMCYRLLQRQELAQLPTLPASKGDGSIAL